MVKTVSVGLLHKVSDYLPILEQAIQDKNKDTFYRNIPCSAIVYTKHIDQTLQLFASHFYQQGVDFDLFHNQGKLIVEPTEKYPKGFMLRVRSTKALVNGFEHEISLKTITPVSILILDNITIHEVCSISIYNALRYGKPVVYTLTKYDKTITSLEQGIVRYNKITRN